MAKTTHTIIADYSDKKEYRGKNVSDFAVDMTIDFSRLGKRCDKGQRVLDESVMLSMVRFMPRQAGVFIAVTKGMSAALAGTGYVVAAAPPMGRYLYYGKNMVDEVTGSPWARKGARKVLVSQFSGVTNAREYLVFSTAKNADAQPMWFEAAKRADLGKWEKIVAKAVGGEPGG